MTIPSPRASKRARIEIIPLIDIIFFLLATFIMVSLSMIKNQSIPVNLPVATTGAPQDRKEYTVISITEKNEVYLNQEKLELAQLDSRLKQLVAANPDPKIFINGDDKAAFGDAISVLDKVRAFGITKIAIETRPQKNQK